MSGIIDKMSSSDSALMHVFGNDVQLLKRIREAKILLVGAGGIGCEVIKTLLLTGFTDVNLIDLDTIDVSNLNRQFLFNRSHVGQSKAEVAAKVSVNRFAHKDVEKPVTVKPVLTPIQNPDFDLDFFRSHSLVINALDNRAARSHVNRMCLAADVPLIESGSEGYVGQVYLIQKGISQCYECEGPKQDQRTFASCTIRNTPSLPIHCIVWAKHLFSQLYGEHDADNDVSPDINDPELQDSGNGVSSSSQNGDANSSRIGSIREWAASHHYDPEKIFDKLFNVDIKYLLSMDKLWESRRKPMPLLLADILNDKVHEACGSNSRTVHQNGSDLKDQRLWSLRECYEIFVESLSLLKNRLSNDPFLVWDKDDAAALDFVTAVSNLRSCCFSIERKSRFDVKSMAGNIIPAIASTNSIVGGLIVLQAISLLRKLPDSREELTGMEKSKREAIFKDACRFVFLKTVSTSASAKNLIASYELFEPKSDCFVCAPGTRELEVGCSFKDTRLVDFAQQLVINKLNFVCPDIQVEGQSCLLWNKEDADEETPEEKAVSDRKKLSDFTFLRNNSRLKVYDLIQNHTVIITLKDEVVDPIKNNGQPFRIVVLSEGSKGTEESKQEPTGTECEAAEGNEAVTLSDDEVEDEGVVGAKITDVALKRAPILSGNETLTTPKKKRID